MTGLLDAALGYVARGWPVFPLHSWDGQREWCTCRKPACENHAKHPRTPHGLKDASTDPEVVRAWWARWPIANVGLRTGVTFDVLDVDGPAGWAELDRLLGEHGLLPAGPGAHTGGGGAHLLFAPTGLGNRTKFRPGLDWRGAGGYVVAPPSVHATGRQYEWDETTPPEVVPEPAPRWLVDLLDPPRAATTVVPVRAPERTGRYAAAALERELGRLAVAVAGTRNDQLNRAAFSLGQLVAAGELDAGTVVDELLVVADRIGLGHSESEATITSGMSRGMAHPRRRAG